MDLYLELVGKHPLYMAIIKFAILGTLGEFVSKWVIHKKFFVPFDIKTILWKFVVWGTLGACIQYAFVGISGFLDVLVKGNYLPSAFSAPPVGNKFIRAFGSSVFINLQFGLFLVLFHRVLDNIILKEKNWKGLDKGLLSLLWFWIPAHTITFSLPKDLRTLMAAGLSVVLGLILGFFNRPK